MSKAVVPPPGPILLPPASAPDSRADGSGPSPSDAISRGDFHAFRQLVERYAPASMALARTILGRSDLAEEAVREAFLRVWRDPDRSSARPGTTRSWVMSAVHRVAVDMVRGDRARHVRTLKATFPDAAGGDDSFDAGETDAPLQDQRQQAFRLALKNLPPEQRQIIELMYFGALTQSEISERLSLPLDAVRSGTMTGMRSLRGADRVAPRASPRHDDGPGGSVVPAEPQSTVRARQGPRPSVRHPIAVQASARGGSAMSVEQGFAVRIETRNKVVNVALRGELDMGTVPVLTDHLVHQERTDVDAIMVDLRELSFMDCAGLHAFLTARDHAEQNGHLLILIGARASARRLFELTGTEHLLDAEAAEGVIARFTGDGGRPTDEAPSFDVDADA